MDVADLSEPLEPTDLGNGVLTTKDFLFGCENILRGPNAGYVVCIKLNASGTAIRAFRYTYSVNERDGRDGLGSAGGAAADESFGRRHGSVHQEQTRLGIGLRSGAPV